MAHTGDNGERIWGGTTLDARQAERRSQLIAAGFELLGEQGAAAVTVRGVTRAAKLSERYFYESFSGRDELLLTVHDLVAEQARGVVTEAVATSSTTEPRELALLALSAFTDFLEEDPRRGRVLLLETFANETLVKHGVELLPSFAALLIEQIAVSFAEPDPLDATLSATALVGALAHLYLAWLDGTIEVPRERLIAHAAELILAVAAVYSHR